MKALGLFLLAACFCAHAGIDDSYQRFLDKNSSLISSQQTMDAIKLEVSTQYKNSGESDVSWFGLDRAMDSHGDEMIASAVSALHESCLRSGSEHCTDIESINRLMLAESDGSRP